MSLSPPTRPPPPPSIWLPTLPPTPPSPRKKTAHHSLSHPPVGSILTLRSRLINTSNSCASAATKQTPPFIPQRSDSGGDASLPPRPHQPTPRTQTNGSLLDFKGRSEDKSVGVPSGCNGADFPSQTNCQDARLDPPAAALQDHRHRWSFTVAGWLGKRAFQSGRRFNYYQITKVPVVDFLPSQQPASFG